jgi:hypothetical protein
MRIQKIRLVNGCTVPNQGNLPGTEFSIGYILYLHEKDTVEIRPSVFTMEDTDIEKFPLGSFSP